MTTKKHYTEEPRLSQTILDDIKRGDFKQNISRDWQELKQFFINEQRMQELQDMGFVRRWFSMISWLLRSLFLKLNPTRRIILLFAFALLILPANFQINGANFHYGGQFTILGLLIVLFILMLELKDKLLAKTELEAGRAVQIALMPEQTPIVKGWDLWLFSRPANDVGGDLVDFFQISDERFSLAIGDVAGKGLSAALLNAKLQSTLRAFVEDFNCLSDLVSKINEIFYRDSIKKIFASFIYLELSPNSDTVKLINAGHLPPIVINHTSIESIDKGGPALGILQHTKYKEQTIELKENDYLFLYSDGVTEAQNEIGHFFSEQRLISSLEKCKGLSAFDFGEKIISILDNFVGDTSPHDDISIIIIRRKK